MLRVKILSSATRRSPLRRWEPRAAAVRRLAQASAEPRLGASAPPNSVAATAAREAFAAVVEAEVRAARKETALPEGPAPHRSLALVVVAAAAATVAEQQARLRSRRKREAAPVGTIRMARAVAQADLPREAERRVLGVAAAAAAAAARLTEEPGAPADQVSSLMPRMDLAAAAAAVPHNREKEARELPLAAVGAARVPVASVERPEPRAPERRASLSFAIHRDS